DYGALVTPSALGLDAAPVQLGETLDQRETDAEPALAPADGSLPLDEQIEDAGEELGGDAHPVVGNAQPRLAALVRHVHVDAAPPRGELERVPQQIDDDLLDPRGVSEDPRGHAVEGDDVLPGAAALPHRSQRALRRFAQVQRLEIEHDLAAQHPAHVEEIVDEAPQTAHPPRDDR